MFVLPVHARAIRSWVHREGQGAGSARTRKIIQISVTRATISRTIGENIPSSVVLASWGQSDIVAKIISD